MRSFICSLISLAALALSASQPFAAGAAYCNAYADYAVETAKLAKAKNCPFDFSSDMWSTTGGVQHAFCASNDETKMDEYRASMGAHWHACSDCTKYADDAVAAWNANVYYLCHEPTTDGRWSNDWGHHFQACMSLWDGHTTLTSLKRMVSQETQARNAAIYQCAQDRAAQLAVCNQYVNDTRNAAQKYAQSGCDLLAGKVTPEAIAPKDDIRFRWCMRTVTYYDGKEYDISWYQVTHELDPTQDQLASVTDPQGGGRTLSACESQKLKRAANRKRKGRSVSPKVLKTIKAAPGGTGASNKNDARGADSRVLAPGLLEGDGGFARQGPAGTGTPSAPTGGGRSLGGSTYSSPH